MEQKIARAEVFYLNPADGWALTTNTTEGFQVGNAEIAYRQKDLINFAVGHYDDLPVYVYRKDGMLSRVIGGE